MKLLLPAPAGPPTYEMVCTVDCLRTLALPSLGTSALTYFFRLDMVGFWVVALYYLDSAPSTDEFAEDLPFVFEIIF